MSGIEQALSNMFPVDWCDPYGKMPLNKEYSVQIDITQVETDNGIRVTAVKKPPQADTTSIEDAISMALGMGCDEIGAENGSQQSADLGKQDSKKDTEESPDTKDSEEKPPDDKDDGGNPFKKDDEKEKDPGE